MTHPMACKRVAVRPRRPPLQNALNCNGLKILLRQESRIRQAREKHCKADGCCQTTLDNKKGLVANATSPFLVAFCSKCVATQKSYPTRIRTWTNRTKICCATVTLSGRPSVIYRISAKRGKGSSDLIPGSSPTTMCPPVLRLPVLVELVWWGVFGHRVHLHDRCTVCAPVWRE